MSEVKIEFLESAADLTVESLPLSHLSIEVGHLYMEDFTDGEGRLRRSFAAVAPWVRTAQTAQAVGCEKKSVRVSTGSAPPRAAEEGLYRGRLRLRLA